MDDDPVPHFTPLHLATPRGRSLALFVVAPLLWVAALAATAVVASRTDAIGVGLAIARASLVLAAVPLAIARRRRVREERAAR